MKTENSKTQWVQPQIIKNLISFAHKYPVTIHVKGEEKKIPDPDVIQGARNIESFMKAKTFRPTDHATTWWHQ